MVYKSLLDIFPFVVGRLGAVETAGVGLDVIGVFVLVLFKTIGFVTTGGFFGGTSKNIKKINHWWKTMQIYLKLSYLVQSWINY